MKWKDKLIDYLVNELSHDSKWQHTAEKLKENTSIGIHLAIFTEPYLSLLCNGEKAIESRFSQSKISPFEKVSKGDLILVKESGGYVKAVFVAGEVKFYTFLNGSRLKEIEDQYGELICTHYDSEFWENRSEANFATLIEVKELKQLSPFHIDKHDRMAWSTLQLGYGNTLFSTIE